MWRCLALMCLLGGCAATLAPVEESAPQASVPEAVDAVRPQLRPETPAAEPAAPTVGALGRTVASLGDAGQPGLWLKTPLVRAQGPGEVFYPETGRRVMVTLIPIEGPATAGSRLSLQAMQALGAPLGGLPEVDVTAG